MSRKVDTRNGAGGKRRAPLYSRIQQKQPVGAALLIVLVLTGALLGGVFLMRGFFMGTRDSVVPPESQEE